MDALEQADSFRRIPQSMLISRKAKYVWCAAFLVLGVVALLLVIIAGAIVEARVSVKSSAPRSHHRPASLASDARPIPQFEDHTCGLLALSAAYRAHSVDPAAKNLRFRLGVDVPADPTDPTSTGTLHPDLFRVLVQDHFVYHLLDSHDQGDLLRLIDHLDSNGIALLLIARRGNGNLHWVLTDHHENTRLRIVDSLFAEPYDEPLNDYAQNHLLSIILIEPRADTKPVSMTRAHTDGISEMERVRRRLSKRD